MTSKFINDKVAEVLAAKERGDVQGVANAIKEALLENDGNLTATLQQMNAAADQQTR
ncbi:hypothetical protein [Streptomyces sp. NPDC001604]|uniref:hypothetical protein n=1 Tax=Streptomyces sp. NPDC001604 TaxID=3364593 RepID=UPI0036AC50B1